MLNWVLYTKQRNHVKTKANSRAKYLAKLLAFDQDTRHW